jgi:hypothetical protein
MALPLKQNTSGLPGNVGWRARQRWAGSLYELNEQYFLGSFWKFWIGPRFDPSDPESAALMREVERVFQSRNKIKECVNRHRRAITSLPYGWYVADAEGRNRSLQHKKKP